MDLRLLAFAVLAAACGQARSPADQDACAADGDCGSGLVCCHTTGDSIPTASSSKDRERGFCVKRDVCQGVAVPDQTPVPMD